MLENPINYRISTSIIKMILNIAIFSTIFYDFGFLDVLCGPMAVMPNPDFFPTIIIIEIINSHYGLIVLLVFLTTNNQILQKMMKSYSLKYFILFIIKLLAVILVQNHRSKYYLHSCLIEMALVIICLFFDFSGNKNILEVVDLTIFDFIHKISVLYQLTRTFCPKFILYWLISNFLYLILSQIQSHMPGNNKHIYEEVYESSLYVKQDIHRFLIFNMIYFVIFSIFQIEAYGYGMLIVCLISIGPLSESIRCFDRNSYLKSILYLVFVSLILTGLIYLRVTHSNLFKPLFLDRQYCSNDNAFYLSQSNTDLTNQ